MVGRETWLDYYKDNSINSLETNFSSVQSLSCVRLFAKNIFFVLIPFHSFEAYGQGKRKSGVFQENGGIKCQESHNKW